MSTGRRTRQAVLGGTGFADRLTELAVAGVPGEAARAVEDGELAVGIVVDAHLGPDEVGPQRALGQLQHQAVVAQGVVVADGALFLDAQDLAPGAGAVTTRSCRRSPPGSQAWLEASWCSIMPTIGRRGRFLRWAERFGAGRTSPARWR